MRACRDVFQITFLYITAVEVGGVQKFLETPSYTEVDPGEDALLKCRISEKKGVCSWQKDNKTNSSPKTFPSQTFLEVIQPLSDTVVLPQPVGMYRGKYDWVTVRSIVSGDCSVWVRAVELQIDDGEWKCQVTASSYNVQDALSSSAAQLVVRASPRPPEILHSGSHGLPNSLLIIPAGSRTTFICEAKYGNPPAYIEWYLDEIRITAWRQKNVSEMGHPRVWSARSVLELDATKSLHEKRLSCRAHHPSYPAPYYRDASTKLNVTYPPTVSVAGADEKLSSLEEGKNNVSLNCKFDGNPGAFAWWTKDGEVVATHRKLVIAPVTRNHSGLYECQAKNSIGTSLPVIVEVDVKFAPRITYVGPKAIVNANLHSQVTLECRAEGNPLPTYHWYHYPVPTSVNASEEGYLISSESRLQIFNVSYSERGRYVCVAQNVIGLLERTHRSEAVNLNVLGPPVSPTTGPAHGWCGSEASIRATACANPPPKAAFWTWNSVLLAVPAETDRFKTLEYETVDDCYHYTLIIKGVVISDAGNYVLHVENDKGLTTQSISFTVHETARVAPLIATALTFGGLLVLLLCLVLRRKRDNVGYKNDVIQRRSYPKGKHNMLPFVTGMHEMSYTLSKQQELCAKTLCEGNCTVANNSVSRITYRSVMESQNMISYTQNLHTIKEPTLNEEQRHSYEEISDRYRI